MRTAAAALAIAIAVAGTAAGCRGAGPPAGPAAPPPAAGGWSAPFALVPDAAAGRIVVRAAPGGRVDVPLRLANAAGAPREFALATTTPWLAVPGRVRVPARSSVAVAAVLSVPADAAPGPRRARVTARAGGGEGAAVSVRYESAVPLGVWVGPRA